MSTVLLRVLGILPSERGVRQMHATGSTQGTETAGRRGSLQHRPCRLDTRLSAVHGSHDYQTGE